jgi:Uma2 family endonuclease
VSDIVPTLTRRWSVADLDELPDDDNRYEIIDGELYVSSAPHLWHQYLVTKLSSLLDGWNSHDNHGLVVSGPGVIFSSEDAVIPAIVWVRREQLYAILQEDGKLHGPPNLAVEVLSPGADNEARDRVTKLHQYGRWGVQEYWMVDRFARAVEVYRLAGTELRQIAVLGVTDELSSPLLPGFSCPVGVLFNELPPTE